VQESFKKTLETFLKTEIEKNPDNEEVYQNSSSREINENQRKIQELVELEKDLENFPKHKEIINVLLEIKNSKFLTLDDEDYRKNIVLQKIEKCKNLESIANRKASINQIISPKGKVFEHFLTPNYELEARANRYNIKNKRITLNSTVNIEETWAILNEPKETKNRNNGKNDLIFIEKKKKFYNKWYLPVKYWKIEKKPQDKEKKLLTGF